MRSGLQLRVEFRALLEKLFLRFVHPWFSDSLTRLLDANCARLWPNVSERSGPEPGRDCSDQNRIPFQFQSAGVLRHADIQQTKAKAA